MPRIRAALVRVYASPSMYGDAPFWEPTNSPKVVRAGDELLEVYFGRAPDWLPGAIGRGKVIAAARMKAIFNNEPTTESALNLALESAPPETLHKPGDNWLVAFILRTEIEGPDLWGDWKSFSDVEKLMLSKVPSLDLAARSLAHFLPHVLHSISVNDRVILARDEMFRDAISIPRIAGIAATPSIRTTTESLNHILNSKEVDRVLSNALCADPVPADKTRKDRFEKALQSDFFEDDGGSYGRYELLRALQPVLLRASGSQPLATMFIDMNGLKQINDTQNHEAGDEAIASFRTAVRAAHSGLLFRTGGDEFVIFTLGSSDEAINTAYKVLAAVEACRIGGRCLSASVGIAFGSNPLEKPKDLVRRADDEMYRAKALSRLEPQRPCTMAVEGRRPTVVVAGKDRPTRKKRPNFLGKRRAKAPGGKDGGANELALFASHSAATWLSSSTRPVFERCAVSDRWKDSAILGGT